MREYAQLTMREQALLNKQQLDNHEERIVQLEKFQLWILTSSIGGAFAALGACALLILHNVRAA